MRFVLYLHRDWYCDLLKGLYSQKKFWNMHLLMTEFDRPEVTPCGRQDVEIYELTTSVCVLIIQIVYCHEKERVPWVRCRLRIRCSGFPRMFLFCSVVHAQNGPFAPRCNALVEPAHTRMHTHVYLLAHFFPTCIFCVCFFRSLERFAQICWKRWVPVQNRGYILPKIRNQGVIFLVTFIWLLRHDWESEAYLRLWWFS